MHAICNQDCIYLDPLHTLESNDKIVELAVSRTALVNYNGPTSRLCDIFT